MRRKGADISGLPEAAYADASFEARIDGVLIYFSVTDGDYKTARQLANAWSDAFRTEIEDRVRFGGGSKLLIEADLHRGATHN